MIMRKQSRMPRRSWGSGRGALTVIAALLFASGVTRALTGSGAAIALEMRDRTKEVMEVSGVPQGESDGFIDVTPDLLALLEEAKERERRVAEREAEIEARVQALALVESAISKDLIRLEEAEANLRATMAMADQAAETDIGRLTAVYENMKPDQAAALFELMEPSFAAGFLGRMRSDSAAAIMAGLTPDLAYTISVVLAGRNAEVPRETVPEALQEMRQQ